MTDSPFPNPNDEAQPDADGDGDEMHKPPAAPHRKPIMVAAGGAVAALTIAFGAFVAHGAPTSAKPNAAAGSTVSATAGRPGARPGTSGSIASKSGSTLTVINPAGQKVTVLTNSATVVSRTMPGSLADIKVGDHVVARGTTTGPAIAATGVTDLGANPPTQAGGAGGGNGGGNGSRPNGGAGSPTPNANAANRGSQGTVTAINPSGFTMTDAAGAAVTVATNGSTTFNITKPSTVASLVVGEQIEANGTTAGDGTVTATTIRVGGGTNNPNSPSTGA